MRECRNGTLSIYNMNTFEEIKNYDKLTAACRVFYNAYEPIMMAIGHLDEREIQEREILNNAAKLLLDLNKERHDCIVQVWNEHGYQEWKNG